MVFDATFSNISAISISSVIQWQSVLMMEETEVPGGNYPLHCTDKLYHIMLYQVHIPISVGGYKTLTAWVVVMQFIMRSRPRGPLYSIVKTIEPTYINVYL